MCVRSSGMLWMKYAFSHRIWIDIKMFLNFNFSRCSVFFHTFFRCCCLRYSRVHATRCSTGHIWNVNCVFVRMRVRECESAESNIIAFLIGHSCFRIKFALNVNFSVISASDFLSLADFPRLESVALVIMYDTTSAFCCYFFNRFVVGLFFASNIYFNCRYWANKHRFERTQSHRYVGPFSLRCCYVCAGCVRCAHSIKFAMHMNSKRRFESTNCTPLLYFCSLDRWQTHTHIAHSPHHIITLQNVHIFGILNSFINTIRIHSLIFFAVLGRWWCCSCCCCFCCWYFFRTYNYRAHAIQWPETSAHLCICACVCVCGSELQLKQHMILFNETICEYTLPTHAKPI